MVPAVVPEKVPEVCEVKVTEAWMVPEPEASEKRPSPPETTKVPVNWKICGLEVGHKVSVTDSKSLSPFAAV